jgi:peptidoglycan-associated lipoprotein
MERQIVTISYGEERPSVLGSNEQAWARNRRAELIY